jgi:hypothetical protein
MALHKYNLKKGKASLDKWTLNTNIIIQKHNIKDLQGALNSQNNFEKEEIWRTQTF